MEFLDQIINFVNEIFRPVMLLAASGLAIYFGSKKIGHKLVAQYTVSATVFKDTMISHVILTNKKDKPIVLSSIYALFNNEIRLSLDKFETPLIIKPFECVSISIPEYSYLTIDNDRFFPEMLGADIYAETGDKLVKCEAIRKPRIPRSYREVTIHKCSYNDFIYDESVAYILVYIYDGKMRTAFIAESGYIGNEWGFSPNFVRGGASPSSIRSFLMEGKFNTLFETSKILKVESLGNVIDVKDLQ